MDKNTINIILFIVVCFIFFMMFMNHSHETTSSPMAEPVDIKNIHVNRERYTNQEDYTNIPHQVYSQTLPHVYSSNNVHRSLPYTQDNQQYNKEHTEFNVQPLSNITIETENRPIDENHHNNVHNLTFNHNKDFINNPKADVDYVNVNNQNLNLENTYDNYFLINETQDEKLYLNDNRTHNDYSNVVNRGNESEFMPNDIKDYATFE